MKTKFTILTGHGQEHYSFDDTCLGEGEILEKFILSTNDKGEIEILPMVKDGCKYYALQFLEKE